MVMSSRATATAAKMTMGEERLPEKTPQEIRGFFDGKSVITISRRFQEASVLPLKGLMDCGEADVLS